MFNRRLASSALAAALTGFACGGQLVSPGDGQSPLAAGVPSEDDGEGQRPEAKDGAVAGSSSSSGSSGSSGASGSAGASGAVAAPPPDPLVCGLSAERFPVGHRGPALCGCTRRPGYETDPVACPVGLNKPFTFTVGPAGGEIELLGNLYGPLLTLTIPAGALTHDTVITATETNIPPPDGYIDWSPVYRLEPADLVFLEPVELKLPWRNNVTGNGPAALSVQWSPDGCTWAPLASSTINAGFHNGKIVKLGYAFSGFVKEGEYTACP